MAFSWSGPVSRSLAPSSEVIGRSARVRRGERGGGVAKPLDWMIPTIVVDPGPDTLCVNAVEGGGKTRMPMPDRNPNTHCVS
jgi:hypothetical protein